MANHSPITDREIYEVALSALQSQLDQTNERWPASVLDWVCVALAVRLPQLMAHDRLRKKDHEPFRQG